MADHRESAITLYFETILVGVRCEVGEAAECTSGSFNLPASLYTLGEQYTL